MLVAIGGEPTDRKENIGEEIKENETQTAQEIYDWYDLNNTRKNLSGDYVLMNDLDENTAGYDELVNTTHGWNPIGDYDYFKDVEFNGTFDGNGYEISNLYIDRPGADYVGLFGGIDEAKVTDVGIVDANVSGYINVGGLIGENDGSVNNSYATGNVSGNEGVGGLVGSNYGTVENSYATGDVNGVSGVGGLVGYNSAAKRIYPERADYTIQRSINISNVGDGSLYYNLTLASPYNISNNDIQYIDEVSFNIDPESHQKYGSEWKSWNRNLAPNQGETIQITYDVRTTTVSWDYSGEESGTVDDISAALKEQYNKNQWQLERDRNDDGQDDWMIQPNHTQIENLAEEIVKDEDNVYDKSRAIYDWIDENIEYKIGKSGLLPKHAAWVLESGTGDCDEQSLLYASLSRAVGIPAWMELGVLYDRSGRRWGSHGWIRTKFVTENGSGGWVNIDLVNDQFYFRDTFRFTTWVDDGGEGHLEDFYYYLRWSEGNIKVEDEFDEIRMETEGRVIDDDVIGDERVDGVIENNYGKVNNSYAIGDVSGENRLGGLIGENFLTVSGSYWDIETSGMDTSAGGIGLKSDEMTGEDALNNMTGFDFEETWETVEEGQEDAIEDGYPILQNISREEQLKAQNVYLAEEEEGGGDTPGFTSMILLMSVVTAVAIYRKKKR